MSSDLPPPSYNDVVSSVDRQPPFPRPDSIQIHHIIVGPGATSLSLPFPDPADVWKTRDISVQDWAAFASIITAALDRNVDVNDKRQLSNAGEHEKKRLMEIVEGWNGGFFEKRGLKVVLNGQDDDAATAAVSSTDGSRFSFGPTKYGVRLGGGMFGVDLSSKKSSSEK
ncbi:hypothetical protein HER10_EVM0010109 [Colletotrichum scovillei]|uniref:Uncharacterized protein n=1 Tax=Colletotrichum scovillei TaxID=1209932 RepID=A0A9P7U9L2_9PEZI|nr:uncharacterized protein HER10_EVM0010109 [Colletotrichum scovillei]KAF4781310.1 hypothetical protein HER10_EVM0010109 [Colletotrichum scovillei]KAG7045670.1 hypothetical protein JMJ77_0009748 [Colletotrichum scovillei]KAG7052831.1 hypothetical protein JMJ78_0005842 [Colletotrichum scovillei]KAG7065123.1 hypothetical protein JMJ76_0012875 [Colletotrichum scovillei]